jgi:hypothetical protein
MLLSTTCTQAPVDTGTTEELSAEDSALLATARWEGTPGSVESLEQGKKLAETHPLLNTDLSGLVEVIAKKPVTEQHLFRPLSDPFSEVKLPVR